MDKIDSVFSVLVLSFLVFALIFAGGAPEVIIVDPPIPETLPHHTIKTGEILC